MTKSVVHTLLVLLMISHMYCAETISLNDLKQILKQTPHTEKISLIVPGAPEQISVLNYLEESWNTLIKNEKSFSRSDEKLKQFHDTVMTLFEDPTMKFNKSIEEYLKQVAKEKGKMINIIGMSNDHTLKSLTIKPNEESLRQALGSIVSAYFDVNHVNRRLKEGKRDLFPDTISIQLK